MQIELKAGLEQGLIAREAMQHRRRQMWAIRLDHGEEVGLGIALVKKDRASGAGGELELAREGVPLDGPGREVTEIIQPGLADGSGRRLLEQGLERGGAVPGPFIGVMRVQADGGPHRTGVLRRHCDRRAGFLEADAGQDHRRDAGGRGTLDDVGAILVKPPMGEVDTDIDQTVVLHPAILLEFPVTMNTEYCADQRPMNWVGDWAGRRRCLTPDRIALVDPERNLQLTYRELDDRARRWATWMVDSLGLGQGDVIALLSRNRLEAIEIFMAAGKVGIVVAPVSHRLSPAEAADILSRLQPEWLLVDTALGDYVEGLQGAVATLRSLAFGAPDSAVEQALERVTPRPVNHPLTLADPCLLVHTGGSTGLPKICRISHRQMVWNAVELLVAAPEGLASRRELVLFPLFHVGGWNTVLPILYAGGCAVVPPAFDPAAVLRAIDTHRINHLGAVEAMLQAIAADPAFGGASLASLEAITTAGAPCAETSMAPFLARGITVRQSYGLTEAGPSNFINARATADPASAVTERASVGTSFFHCDYRIVDPADGSAVPTGESGELQLRSPHDFDGYLDDPERTRSRWTDDGWIRSGDLAREDAEGRVFIVGRIDNVIVSGGENIAAEEVERLLGEHPAIKGVMVFGVPDERWGERPVAWLTGPAHDALPGIRDWLDDRLARFKHPATLQVVEALPVTGAGKPDRRRAREAYIQATQGEGP